MVQARGLHKGIKLSGQEAKNTVKKEMQQHHGMETYIPANPLKLTYTEKQEAVELLCLFTGEKFIII